MNQEVRNRHNKEIQRKESRPISIRNDEKKNNIVKIKKRTEKHPKHIKNACL